MFSADNKSPQPSPKKIILAFDMDGCALNDYYRTVRDVLILKNKRELTFLEDQNLWLQTSQEFLTDMLKIVDGAIEIHLISASNRQDYETDVRNRSQQTKDAFTDSMSNYHAMQCLQQYFQKNCPHAKVVLHKYTLADTYAKKPAGYAFDLALKALNGATNIDHPSYYFDKSKFTLLYPQFHYFAQQLKINKNNPFEYWFIDDHDDYIQALHRLFTQKSDYIPVGLTCHMKAAMYRVRCKWDPSKDRATKYTHHEYTSVDSTNYCNTVYQLSEEDTEKLHIPPIAGQGRVNPNFESTLLTFARGYSPDEFYFLNLSTKKHFNFVVNRMDTILAGETPSYVPLISLDSTSGLYSVSMPNIPELHQHHYDDSGELESGCTIS